MSEYTRGIVEQAKAMAERESARLTIGVQGGEVRNTLLDLIAQLAAEVDRLSDIVEPLG